MLQYRNQIVEIVMKLLAMKRVMKILLMKTAKIVDKLSAKLLIE